MCKHTLQNPTYAGGVKYRNTIATWDGNHAPIVGQ